MIDELWLTAAVQDAAETISVPPDGPDGVVAARRSRFSGTKFDDPFEEESRSVEAAPRDPGTPQPGRDRRRIEVAGAVAAALVVMVGIALWPSHPSKHAFTAVGSAVSSGPGATASDHALEEGGASSGQAAGAGTQASAAPGSPVAPLPSLPTRVVKTGSVELLVRRGAVSTTISRLTTDAAGLGGYVADAKTVESGADPSANLTLRVPNDQFENLLDQARALGQPLSVTTAGRDVTSDYVDLGARIKSLEATRDQFLQILTRANAVGDILAVEQQISGLQTQIEQLQGQQRVLDDQTTFGTLAVHVAESTGSQGEPVRPKSPSGLSKSWAHARHAFADGVESLIAASGGLAVFLLVAAALGLAARGAWRLIRRRLV